MKRSWLLAGLFVGFVAVAPVVVRAQVSAYGEFSAALIDGAPKGDPFYGGSVGVLIDGPTIFKHFLVSPDISGTFISKDSQRLDSVTIGPRISAKGSVLKLTPFVAFGIGFGRFNNGSGISSTDYIFGGTGGVYRKLSSHIDLVVDYKYQIFGYNFNAFNPMTVSGGIVYRLAKR